MPSTDHKSGGNAEIASLSAGPGPIFTGLQQNRLQSGEALVEAKCEIERLKGEVEEAWNQCKSTEVGEGEADATQQSALLQQSTSWELQGELQRKETEAAEAKATSDRSLAHLNAKVNHLERENATLRTQCNRGARFRELDPSIVNSREVSRQNVRVRDSLTAYLDANLEEDLRVLWPRQCLLCSSQSTPTCCGGS